MKKPYPFFCILLQKRKLMINSLWKLQQRFGFTGTSDSLSRNLKVVLHITAIQAVQIKVLFLNFYISKKSAIIDYNKNFTLKFVLCQKEQQTHQTSPWSCNIQLHINIQNHSSHQFARTKEHLSTQIHYTWMRFYCF